MSKALQARDGDMRPATGPSGGGAAAARSGADRGALFQRVRVEPAYKAVSAQIERHILNGDLTAGEPLPTEQVLCERFGVHRSTVREAIRRVEQDGLLQRREGRRLYVTLPGLVDVAPRTNRLLLQQQVTFRELWDVAVALEPVAARLAAVHADEHDLARLAANLEACTTVTARCTQATRSAAERRADHAALAALDVDFHALVGEASHNRALMLAREPVGLFYRPTLFEIHERLPQSLARNLAAHRHILQALRHRDAEAAARWTHRHMVDFQRGFTMAGLDIDTPIALPSFPADAPAPLN